MSSSRSASAVLTTRILALQVTLDMTAAATSLREPRKLSRVICLAGLLSVLAILNLFTSSGFVWCKSRTHVVATSYAAAIRHSKYLMGRRSISGRRNFLPGL